jgi:hypothetical protein
MNAKVTITGPLSVKFRVNLPFGIKINRTYTTKVNETVDLGKVNLPSTTSRVVGIPGPVDLVLKIVSVDDKEANFEASLVLDGFGLPLYTQTVKVDLKTLKTPGLRIRLNNVRGVTADLTVGLELSK